VILRYKPHSLRHISESRLAKLNDQPLLQKQPLRECTVFSYSAGETPVTSMDFSFVCQRHSLHMGTNPLIPTGKRTKIICFQ